MRFHATTKGNIPFTLEEEEEADRHAADYIASTRPTAEKIIDGADRIAKEKRDMLTSTISAAEMACWSIKRAEALAYRSRGIPADAPSLLLEAQARGISLDDLVGKVLGKAAQLSALEAAIAGRCGAIQDAARAAQNPADLVAIDVNSGWPV